MAHIVILGAGLGGMPMAYEMKEQLRPGDTVTVVGNGPNFHFVPSNPWVAVDWRKRSDIEFPAAPYLAKKGIAFNPAGAKRVHPDRNQVELGDGTSLDYDYLIIATGPEARVRRDRGSGTRGPHAVGLQRRPRGTRGTRPGTRSSRTPARSSSARCRARRASARRTSSRSSWKRTCAGASCATACR